MTENLNGCEIDKEEKLIINLLEQAAFEGQITCPVCDGNIEPDCDTCGCGWENLLVRDGYI